MIIQILDKTEGSLDSYGDPTDTWTAYEIDADTLHPYRYESLRFRDYGTFRGTMYQLAFASGVTNLDYVEEGNRFGFWGDQFLIIVRDKWIDSAGYIIRVYTIVEKCADVVSYGWG